MEMLRSGQDVVMGHVRLRNQASEASAQAKPGLAPHIPQPFVISWVEIFKPAQQRIGIERQRLLVFEQTIEVAQYVGIANDARSIDNNRIRRNPENAFAEQRQNRPDLMQTLA
ncbi:MAG: hypothetical protein AAFN79_20275 [Pseudomonadota bacterium]